MNHALMISFLLLILSPDGMGRDTTIIVEDFNFKISTQTRLDKQEPFPIVRDRFKGCPEYGFMEWKTNDENYFGEVRVIDCRKRLRDEDEHGKKSFFNEYVRYVYSHYYPDPDSTQTYRNLFCMVGGGKFVKQKGEPLQKFKYVIFLYKDCIYQVTAIDRSSKIKDSFKDLLVRFDLLT